MNYKLLLFGFLSLGFARISAQTFPLQVKEEKLTYVTDERGNRILDYSSCGYRNSEYPIPDVANAVFGVVRRQEVIGFSRTGIDVIHHNKEAGTF